MKLKFTISPLFLASILMAATSMYISAEDLTSDSVALKMEKSDTTSGNLISKIIRYFSESNKPKEAKKIDFSIIGGPHYSSDTKFGIGVVAAANYRVDPADTLTTPSFVGLYGDLTTSGSWMVGIKGAHIFPRDRRRIDYAVTTSMEPSDFWGIGYKSGARNADKTKYDDLHVSARANFMWQVSNGFFIGPGIETDYYSAGGDPDNPGLWEGEDRKTFTIGVALKAQLDTRDNLTFPHRGWLLAFSTLACPSWMGNDYAFAMVDINACHYRQVWRGGILAGQFHTALGFGSIPWGILPTFGGSESMRGYYLGRYRDKREADLTIELRQHLFGRNSIVLWTGAATVFDHPDELRWSHILPNVGVGYRWEFKKNTNVRLDFGVGRGTTGFVFSINEAF